MSLSQDPAAGHPCENEAIHTPDAIQPHGALIVLRADNLLVRACSANIEAFLGLSVADTLGKNLTEVFGQQRAEYIRQCLSAEDLRALNPLRFTRQVNGQFVEYDLILHRHQEDCYLEFESLRKGSQTFSNPFRFLRSSVVQMQAAPDLPALYQTIVREMRKITGFHRVKLYRFDVSWQGEVLAENKSDELPSLLSLRFPDLDIPPQARQLYTKNLLRIVPDVDYTPVPVHTHPPLSSEQPLDLSMSVLRSLSPWHIGYLRQMKVQASMSISILKDQQLWGLLICHHLSPHYLSYETRAACELLGQIFSSQIVLKEAEEQRRYAEAKGHLLNVLIEQISAKADVMDALSEHTRELLELADAQGAAVCIGEDIHLFGQTPPKTWMLRLAEWLADEVNGDLFHTDRLPALFPAAAPYQTQCCGLLAARLGSQKGHYLIWMRAEQIQVVKWAGPPAKPGLPQLPNAESTRNFEPWKEVIRQRALPWNDTDLYYIAELRNVVTESRYRQVQAMAEENAKFRLMLQNASDILLILDQDFAPRYASDAARQILGQEISGRKRLWIDLIHPQDREAVLRQLEELRRTPNAKRILEYRIRTHKDRYARWEMIAVNLLSHAQIRGIIANARDITTRVQTQKRMKKFQQAIESGTNGVVFINASSPEYIVTFANAGYEHITGQPLGQVVGSACRLFDERYMPNAEEARQLRQLVTEGQTGEILISGVKPDGTPYWMQVHAAPIYEESEQSVNYVLVCTDVTFARTAEEKLREYTDRLQQRNEELQTFAYVASHDLQEPLRTIMGFSELLLEMYGDKLDQEAQEYFGFMLQAATRMKTLIQDLLQFSRVGTQKEFIAETDCNRVLRIAIENLRSAIDESRAVITSDHLPVVIANETYLLQVIQNLLSNAIKYCSPERPPRVHIGMEEREHEWLFSIKDNGIGIEERFYQRIFVIFQRLHTKEQYSGTGIGLAICKKIVEKYGGRIWVQSEKDKGSVFYFILPKHLTLMD